MKRILFAAATVLALSAAQPTLAADAPVYKGPAPVAAALFNWSGFYVGGTIGGLWGDGQYTNLNNGFVSARYNISGWIAGLTAGVNWQTGAWVFGLEGDYSWTNATGQDTSGCFPPACVTTFSSLGTIRGRAGWAAGRALFYVTGGWAFSQFRYNQAGFDDVSASPSGWVFGGGIEYAIWNNWSIKGEYLYVNLGNPITFLPIIANNIRHDLRLNVARFGLNYRF